MAQCMDHFEDDLFITHFPELNDEDFLTKWVMDHYHVNWKKLDEQVTDYESADLYTDSEHKKMFLKYNSIQTTCGRANKLLRLSLVKGQYGKAEALVLSTFNDLLTVEENNFLDSKHLYSLMYLLRGIARFIVHLKEKVDLKNEVVGSDSFEVSTGFSKLHQIVDELSSRLPPCTKYRGQTEAVISYVRHHFLRRMDKTGSSQCYYTAAETFRKIILMDPECYFWHYWLRVMLMLERMGPRNQFTKYKISGEEIIAAEKAYSLSPEHPLVILDFCSTLCSVVNKRRGIGSLVLGSHRFESKQNAWDFVKEQLDKVNLEAPGQYLVNITLSKFFFTLLPKHERDYEKGKMYLQRALDINPTATRVNYQMAMCLLFQERNYSQAITYFELAVRYGPGNARARIELIKLLLGNAGQNRDKILKLIDDQLVNEDLVAWRADTYHFLKGCLFFMGFDNSTDNRRVAAAEWIKSSDACADLFGDENLIDMSVKYGWSRGMISRNKIVSVIMESDVDGNLKREFFRIVRIRPVEVSWRNPLF